MRIDICTYVPCERYTVAFKLMLPTYIVVEDSDPHRKQQLRLTATDEASEEL